MNQLKEIKLSYRLTKNKKIIGKINSSDSAFEIIYSSWNLNEIGVFETFKVLYLDNANNVKGIATLSSGGITGTLIDVRLIMATALKSLSTCLVLAHNHPSGTLLPSHSDKTITSKIKTAANYFDIKLLDHLIITPNKKFYSFADNYLL